jgi:hypothetical protein
VACQEGMSRESATLAGIFGSLVMGPCGPTGMALVCPNSGLGGRGRHRAIDHQPRRRLWRQRLHGDWSVREPALVHHRDRHPGRRCHHRGQRHTSCDEPDIARVSAALRRRGSGGRRREAHRRGEAGSCRRVQRHPARVQRGARTDQGAGPDRADEPEVTLSLDQEVAQEARHVPGSLDQQPVAVAGQDRQLGPCDLLMHPSGHVGC